MNERQRAAYAADTLNQAIDGERGGTSSGAMGQGAHSGAGDPGRGGPHTGGQCPICQQRRLHTESGLQEVFPMGGRDSGGGHWRSAIALDVSILNPIAYRPVIRRAYIGLMGFGAFVALATGGAATYLIGFDRAAPLANPTARLIEYDPIKSFMVVEWSFDKLRTCQGERKQKLLEPGSEPPPRVGLSLPSETFTGDELSLGPHTIRRMIELPRNRPLNFIYKAKWAFSCNTFQSGSNAIIIESPPVPVASGL